MKKGFRLLLCTALVCSVGVFPACTKGDRPDDDVKYRELGLIAPIDFNFCVSEVLFVVVAGLSSFLSNTTVVALFVNIVYPLTPLS